MSFLKTSIDKALALLAARARTAIELERALQRAGYDERERKSALARMKELGYIDDREVARTRARARVERGDSPRLAARKLQAQGVAAAEARGAASEAAEGAGEDELAARALRKRLRGRQPADEREKRRHLRALIAKGHRPSAAAKALGMEWDGDDDLED